MSGSAELLATMAVIAAGAMLGRVQFRGVRLDVAAMLLLGAAVAHFGITLSPSLGLFGLLLFLYTVGVQSGPALRSIQLRELKLASVGLGVLMALLGGMVVVGFLLELPVRVTLGSFSGFFGSGAALGLLEGNSTGSGASAGFAVAAPVSSLLVMILVQAWRAAVEPKIQGEVDSWNETMSRQQDQPEIAEIVVEQPEITDLPLRQLRLGCQVLWVNREEESFPADADTVLKVGDVLHVSCSREAREKEAQRLGRLIPPTHGKRKEAVVVRKFFVSNADAINERLETFLLRERYGATVTRIRRAGLDLRARPGFRFRWGDRVQVSARVDKVESLRKLFGDDAHGLEEFAFPRAALVIFVGGMLGAVPIHLGGSESLRLGPALGVLVVSLATAALHRTGPMVWSQSGPTARLMSHIGLPLFLAQIGNESYGGLANAWTEHGVLLVALAVAPVILLALLAILAGKIFKYGPLTVLSLVPSIALNTPALTTLQNNYREKIPGHVYAAVYPFVALGLLAIMFVLSLIV